MPINSPNDTYGFRAAQWSKIRDVLAGEDAVKAAGGRYLPRPAAMNFKDYAAYRDRAPFMPATARALAGMIGQVFAHEPSIALPGRLDYLQRDCDRTGRPLSMFARSALEETLSIGRVGVLVDIPATGGQPYLCEYCSEDIINWRYAVVGDEPVLAMVVLRESIERPKDEDRFATETIDRFRLLELAGLPEGGAPVYSVTVFEHARDAGRDEFRIVMGPIIPRRRGQPLERIPFIGIGANDLGLEPCEPPLAGMASLNLSHYRSMADLEAAVFYCGAPILHIAGNTLGNVDGDGAGPAELTVGPGQAIHTELHGTVTMVQAGADSIGAARAHGRDKLDSMAALGARLIEPSRAGGNPDHVDAQRLKYRAEDSVLMQAANTTSRGLSRALKLAEWWSSMIASVDDAESEIALSTDFDTQQMAPREIVDLVGAWMNGGIGGKVLWHNLAKGEVLPPDQADDFDEFTRDLEEHGPAAAYGP